MGIKRAYSLAMELEFVTIDNNTYAKYLAYCHLPNLTVIPASNTPPAVVFNRVMERSTSKYIAFIHSDVKCKGLVEAINRTIYQFQNFGALGAVGATYDGIQWARKHESYPVLTIDSCLLIINREHRQYFDQENFDSYHLFVEEYCMRIRAKLGKDIRTILIDGYEGEPTFIGADDYFAHMSNTVNQLGGSWGNYQRYHDKLKKCIQRSKQQVQ